MQYLLMIILLVATFSVSADEMTVSIPLDISLINFHEEGVYTRVTGIGMMITGVAGAPSLPEFTTAIALPTGCTATSIEVIHAEYTAFYGRFNIMPATKPVPFSVEQEISLPEPDPHIYGSSTPYPEKTITFEGSSVVMGIPVAYASIHPVRWNPASGIVEVITELTLKVSYETNPEASTISRRSFQSEFRSQEIVRNSVVNPEAVSASGAVIVDSKDLTYGEYVIIATPAYASHAQELADWKTSKGIPTNVYTTVWIQSQYSFVDLMQEIRAFLTDCRDEGVEYVLIYGDDDIIAARDVWLGAHPDYNYCPCDMYLSDINDTFPGDDRWNSDGDNTWGEMYDDDIDYHPDLWVGRASMNSTNEATIFNEKVFLYERVSATDHYSTAPAELRIGYSTGFLFGNAWGSDGAELISALVPGSWEQTKCYESSNNNSRAITINMINAGPHHVHHASHGGETAMYTAFADYYYASDIMAQTNISSGGLPAIWNTIACLSGHFDDYESCSDAWLNSPNGGGFGVFNVRYGFGNVTNPGYGISEILARNFYVSMWTDDNYNFGVANAMGKDKMAPPIGDEYVDWILKGYTLFGDPELPMWFVDAPNLSASHPSSITGNSSITVTVTSEGSPVSGARVCLQKGDWQTGDIYEVGTTGGSGSVVLSVQPATTGTISVVAWGRDKISYQGSITVASAGVEHCNDPRAINNVRATYPNPATSSATIPFSLASSGTTRVDVYDVTGRIVSTLASEEMATGQHTLVWNLEDTSGSAIPSGIYHIRISTANWAGTTNLVVVR